MVKKPFGPAKDPNGFSNDYMRFFRSRKVMANHSAR